MKEDYVKPKAYSMKNIEGIVPFAVAAALVGGYAVGRAVANELKARPIHRLQGIGDNKSDLSMD